MEENIEHKKLSSSKKILFTIGFILVMAIIVNSMREAYNYVKPEKEDNSAAWPVVTVSLTTLDKEFTENADFAASKYKEKLVLVSGVIKEIDKYHTGDSYIILQPENDKDKAEIECLFKDEKNIDSLQKGNTISVKGKPEYKSDKLYLQKAELSK